MRHAIHIGILGDAMTIAGSLARNMDFEVANFKVHEKIADINFVATKCESLRKSLTKCSSLLRLQHVYRVYGASCKICPFSTHQIRLDCHSVAHAWHFLTVSHVCKRVKSNENNFV